MMAKTMKCDFCNKYDDDELIYGKFYQWNNITTHYFCLLLSSNATQQGTDKQGIMGFMGPEIRAELKRGKRLKCTYCKKTGATLGCCGKGCIKTFHLPCGIEKGSVSQFFGQFKSFCSEHAPTQVMTLRELEQLSTQSLASDSTCGICYENVTPCISYYTLWSNCCGHGWYHRQCMQKLAVTAGKYFFKCPLCSNNDRFVQEMQRIGIYVPIQDAAWETEPQAFEDLLYRPNTCEAEPCKCPHGRDYTKDDTIWSIAICTLCGAVGVHIECKNLPKLKPNYQCGPCIEALHLKNKAEMEQLQELLDQATPTRTKQAHESLDSGEPSLKKQKLDDPTSDNDSDVSLNVIDDIPERSLKTAKLPDEMATDQNTSSDPKLQDMAMGEHQSTIQLDGPQSTEPPPEDSIEAQLMELFKDASVVERDHSYARPTQTKSSDKFYTKIPEPIIVKVYDVKEKKIVERCLHQNVKPGKSEILKYKIHKKGPRNLHTKQQIQYDHNNVSPKSTIKLRPGPKSKTELNVAVPSGTSITNIPTRNFYTSSDKPPPINDASSLDTEYLMYDLLCNDKMNAEQAAKKSKSILSQFPDDRTSFKVTVDVHEPPPCNFAVKEKHSKAAESQSIIRKHSGVPQMSSKETDTKDVDLDSILECNHTPIEKTHPPSNSSVQPKLSYMNSPQVNSERTLKNLSPHVLARIPRNELRKIRRTELTSSPKTSSGLPQNRQMSKITHQQNVLGSSASIEKWLEENTEGLSDDPTSKKSPPITSDHWLIRRKISKYSKPVYKDITRSFVKANHETPAWKRQFIESRKSLSKDDDAEGPLKVASKTTDFISGVIASQNKDRLAPVRNIHAFKPSTCDKDKSKLADGHNVFNTSTKRLAASTSSAPLDRSVQVAEFLNNARSRSKRLIQLSAHSGGTMESLQRNTFTSLLGTSKTGTNETGESKSNPVTNIRKSGINEPISLKSTNRGVKPSQINLNVWSKKPLKPMASKVKAKHKKPFPKLTNFERGKFDETDSTGESSPNGEPFIKRTKVQQVLNSKIIEKQQTVPAGNIDNCIITKENKVKNILHSDDNKAHTDSTDFLQLKGEYYKCKADYVAAKKAYRNAMEKFKFSVKMLVKVRTETNMQVSQMSRLIRKKRKRILNL